MPTKPVDTNVEQLVINHLTKTQYDEAKAAGKINPTELYLVPDDKVKADEVTYDNTTSKLKANDVQGAITELDKNIKTTNTQVDSKLNGKLDKSAVDKAMSTTSTNPVQNKVVDAAIKAKPNINDTTASKTEVYSSGKVDELLEGKANIAYVNQSFAGALKGRAFGPALTIEDVAEPPHDVGCSVSVLNLSSTSPKDFPGLLEFDAGTQTYTIPVGAHNQNTIRLFLLDKPVPFGTIFSISLTFESGKLDAGNLYFGFYSGGWKGLVTVKPGTLTGQVKSDTSMADVAVQEFAFAMTGGVNVSSDIKFKLQIQLGEPTDWEPHIADPETAVIMQSRPDGSDATAFNPGKDGLISGMRSLHPSMVLTSNKTGVAITCGYNRDITKALDALEARLQALVLSN